ncbi:MAG: hypothetical protein R6X32_11680 [Chloroflexota bacterium]
MQDTQRLKAKIITLLDFLPADSLKLLAEFAAFLRAKSGSYDVVEPSMVQEQVAEITFETAVQRQQPIRVVSPRLVNREQIADFRLEVIEEANDRLQ